MLRFRHIGLPILVAALLILSPPAKTLASGVVTNTTQSSLLAAMAGGGTVTFTASGTIYLTNTIVVSNNTVLDGTGPMVAISGSNACQIFIVNPGVTLALTNLTLRDGFSQHPSGNAVVNIYGGAISNGGTLDLASCTFISNSAVGLSAPTTEPTEGAGGAIYNGGSGILAAFACTFSGNSAIGGSGVSAFALPFFTPPGASANGGALFNANQATIINCIFSNNTAVGGAGGTPPPNENYDGQAGGTATGGAICNSGSFIVSNSAFALNAAEGGTGGGGGRESYGLYQYTGGNGGVGASAVGGGVGSVGGSVVFVNDTFWGNRAVGGSGGSGGNGSFPSPPFSGGNGGNGALGGNGTGGAFCSTAGTIQVTNVTVASNSVVGGAAGAAGVATSVFGFYYNTATNGVAGSPGSAEGDCIGNLGGVVTIKNSILAPNVSSDTNLFGSITDAGNNISSDTQKSLTSSTSMNGVNPNLAPLGNYGGPTPTMALLPGSPAVDAADPAASPATDQRGFSRPFGPAPDIGAFETTYSITISGQITGLMPPDQATVTVGRRSTITTNGGGYALLDDSGSWVVIPTNANYVFAPPIQIINLASNQTNVNFQAYRRNVMTLNQTSANVINLVFAGTTGQQIRVEISTNLSDWTPIAAYTVGLAGYITMSFPTPIINSDRGFFRIVSP